MTELEKYVAKKIETIVPGYDSLELTALITNNSFSIEFFATKNGTKKQCFDMIDEGVFTETEFNEVSRSIANYCRKSSGFDSNGINKYIVSI